MTPKLVELFDCDPNDFVKSSERVSAIIRRLMKKEAPVNPGPQFAVDHWEDMMGVPCPDDIAVLAKAFSETGAPNTALYAQGRPMVFSCAGFGNFLQLSPYEVAPDSVDWRGTFDEILDLDPGGNHATALGDLVKNQVEIGGEYEPVAVVAAHAHLECSRM